jgi:hypothetical protein
MPNGGHHPQCGHCRHFAAQRCRRHDFVVPYLGEVICRDYELSDQRQPFGEWEQSASDGRYLVHAPEELPQFSNGLHSLEPGCLYQYGYHSAGPPWKLGRFTRLQRPIATSHADFDGARGWILRISWSEPTLLPAVNKPFTLSIGRQEHTAEIVEATTTYHVPWVVDETGQWRAVNEIRTRREKILCLPNEPQVIGEWLGRHVELDRWLEARRSPDYVGTGEQVLIEAEIERCWCALHYRTVGTDDAS